MRVVIFCHSLVSDWNHGNAHFLRGVVQELLDRDIDVRVFEPESGWSRTNLLAAHGPQAIDAFHDSFPRLRSETYDEADLNLDQALREADLVLVHEWNDPAVVAAVGRHHAAHNSYVLLFHDTHHRSVTDPAAMRAYDLRYYDGVLAFGDVIRDLYLSRGWARQAWTWHEAADTRVFAPPPTSIAGAANQGDIVWVGNWGDEERTAELDEFLLEPVRRLGLHGVIYGVRYPPEAIERLADSGIEYRGWLPNYRVPEVFAGFKVTVHVPRRPYVEQLPGIPTIRPFEALACGVPLVSARWCDAANLFSPGDDFLVAADGAEMTSHLETLVTNAPLRRRLAERGRQTILERHTCGHRVDELMDIYMHIQTNAAQAATATA